MITQTFKQGNNEIKIESAENIEDLKNNNFKHGEYQKFYVNGKKVDNYMALMRYIIEETKKNKSKLVKNDKELINQRNQIILNQKNAMKKQLEDLKKQYEEIDIKHDLSFIDKYIEKIDEFGVRRHK